MVQNFLNVMQFFRKFGKIIGWRPLPGGLAPPPTENPGSAPEFSYSLMRCSVSRRRSVFLRRNKRDGLQRYRLRHYGRAPLSEMGLLPDVRSLLHSRQSLSRRIQEQSKVSKELLRGHRRNIILINFVNFM